MTQPQMGKRAIRLILLGMMIGFAAYWAGARWGARQATRVEALPISAKSEVNGILTDEETINVRVYRAASPAVANIITRAVEYDFFMDAVPVEGCLLYTSPSPRDLSTSRMPSSA